MSAELWGAEDLARAAGGRIDGAFRSAVTGFSIDTRTLEPGDVFVALRDVRDGHEFVGKAFRAGAVAAIVAEGYERRNGDGALIRVSDTLRALEQIGVAARNRLAPGARVFAVTGSVGKTTTKEMLRACLSRLGPTHAADKSFNNHIGVPLTLARMPASSRYAVFEIGMNHAGEITPLTRMVCPHVAIVTTVEAVHLEHFASVEAIADAKAEIFAGIEPGGTAIVKRDNPYFQRLTNAATARGVRVVGFGGDGAAEARFASVKADALGSDVTADIGGRRIVFRVGAPGRHLAENALAVAAALDAAGLDLDTALAALAGLGAPPGRGARSIVRLAGGDMLVIDESYNANPASMRAALAALAGVARSDYPRRLAVLGEMLELGPDAAALHEGLVDALDAAGVDLVFACGPNMRRLFDKLEPRRRGAWAERSDGIGEALAGAVRPGDVVMLKGSNGARLAPLVEALKGIGGQVAATA
jgi:UDP-N-acetylmuramoyl-tripeptide--D-alanyl-D-alanine ligase